MSVDCEGREFFTRSRFTVDQDASVGRGHHADLLAQGFHGNALANNYALGVDLLLELRVFTPQVMGFKGILDEDERLIERKGLFQEIEGPKFSGADGRFNRAVAGNHDDLRMIFDLPDPLQGFQSIYSGK